MKRAENALRYQRLDKALDLQSQNSNALAQMAYHLQSALDADQKISTEELTKMLQSVLQNADKVQKAKENDTSAQEQRELYQKVHKEIMEITRRLNDQNMDNVSQLMAAYSLGNSSSSADLNHEILALLFNAAKILESKITKSNLQRMIRLTQLTGEQPPDEYKKLVNQYFKNLSNIY